MVFLMKKGVCDELELSAARLLKFLLSRKCQKFNFSKYIFESLVRNFDSTSKFYMYPRVGKGFSGVETPLFVNMLEVRTVEAEEEVQIPAQDDAVQENVTEQVAAAGTSHIVDDVAQPTSPLPPSPVLDKCSALVFRVEGLETANVSQQLEIIKLKARVKKLERLNKVKSSNLRRLKKVATSQRVESSEDIENVFNQGRISVYVDEGIELKVDQEKSAEVDGRQADIQAEIYNIDLDHSSKVLSMQEDTKVQEVAAVSAPVPAAKPKVLKIAAAPTVSIRKKKGVVIRDPKEELHKDTPAETLSVKDKGKGILIEDPKLMKKKDQIAMDADYAKKLQEELETEHEEAYKKIDWNAAFDHNTEGFKMEYFKGKTYDQILPIFQARFDANLKFLFKSREEMEKEDEEIIKSINETPAQKAAKRRRLREQAKEDEDLKKYKIIRADDTHQLYTSFITLLKNFDKEDLEDLWKIVKARFSTTKSTNFSNDYLLATLKTMFEKTDRQDAIWTSQQTGYGQALVKSWKLLTSCGVHIISLSTTMFVLLVERRYPLSKFTLEQLVNVARLQVEEENEMSLELLRFTRQQLLEYQQGLCLNTFL
nr:hypothetical protein [Tanacetum cinerariifolium]